MKPSKIRNRTMHKAPLSVRSKLVASHLNKQLRKTYMRRSLRVIPGDSVSIYRGIYNDINGKVEKIDLHRGVVISGIQDEKTEGKKIDIYIHPSNLLITSLNLDDKWRAKKLKADTTKREVSGDAKPVTLDVVPEDDSAKMIHKHSSESMDDSVTIQEGVDGEPDDDTKPATMDDSVTIQEDESLEDIDEESDDDSVKLIHKHSSESMGGSVTIQEDIDEESDDDSVKLIHKHSSESMDDSVTIQEGVDGEPDDDTKPATMDAESSDQSAKTKQEDAASREDKP